MSRCGCVRSSSHVPPLYFMPLTLSVAPGDVAKVKFTLVMSLTPLTSRSISLPIVAFTSAVNPGLPTCGACSESSSEAATFSATRVNVWAAIVCPNTKAGSILAITVMLFPGWLKSNTVSSVIGSFLYSRCVPGQAEIIVPLTALISAELAKGMVSW